MTEKMTEREQFYYDKGYNKAIEEAADLARKPNKMEVVAAFFGKQLGEEFKIKYGDSLAFEAAVKFTKKNFRVKHLPLQDYWSWDNELLVDLLTGRAVIVDENR